MDKKITQLAIHNQVNGKLGGPIGGTPLYYDSKDVIQRGEL